MQNAHIPLVLIAFESSTVLENAFDMEKGDKIFTTAFRARPAIAGGLREPRHSHFQGH